MKNAIQQRRSCRSFSNKNINNTVIYQLLYAASLAPSAKNRQPWEFCVLKGPSILTISDLLKKYSLEQGNKNSSVVETAKVMSESNCLLLILRPDEEAWLEEDTLSIGACAQNILLAATELDIGSLFIRDTCFIEKEILDLLQKENKKLSCTIALGYSNEKTTSKKTTKKISEIMQFWETFN